MEDLVLKLLLQQLANLRHFRGTSRQDDLVDIVRIELFLLERLVDHIHALVEKIHGFLLKSAACDQLVDLLAASNGRINFRDSLGR